MTPIPVPITLCAAGILGLIYLALTATVVSARFKTKTMQGAGGTESGPLPVAIRAHGNFSEYVPLALILLGGIEWAGAPRILCLVLAAMLVAGRLLHPFGMVRPAPNPLRAAGAMLTWTMLGIAAITAVALTI